MTTQNTLVLTWAFLPQDGATAGAAPAPAAAPVNAVGVPGGAAPVTNGTVAPGTGTGAQPAPGGMNMIFWALPLMLLLLIFSQVMAGRKDKKRRQELMSSIKKGEKVQTLGGVIGTIIEVGDHDVVLRVEEGRIRFAKSAIQTVLAASKDKPANGTIESKPDVKATV